MESSEDDAGTATSASRGASARETDDGKSEDVDPTPRFQHESSETRMSCSTPTMSEDNFDGDSVPSPSAQDVNTSTEAILDMIDEFVDGPGAPKRLSLVSNNELSTESTSNSDTQREPEPPPTDKQILVQPQVSSPVASTDAENNSECTSQMSIECTSQISSECTSQTVEPDCANTGVSVSLPPTDTVQVREVESNEHKSDDLDTENETVTVPTVSSSPSSSVQTVNESVQERNVDNKLIQETEPKNPIPDAENETVPDPPVSNYSPSSSENTVQESVPVRNIESHSTQQAEPISFHLDAENEIAVVPSVPSSPSCSEQTQDPVQIGNIETHSTLSTEPQSSDLNTENETVMAPSVSISSSSSEQSVQNVSDSSDCKRTVKSVTSSDIRDNVTVERAESTSSECSVTESRCLVAEPVTRSPLRRRLVRPVPSDRRPDSTVSSTVDSQVPTVNTIPQTSSEVIIKDVSSSSDAVPSGNTKPEEISNVSEISICKAETSSTPSKKIKLIRPKITPVTSNSSKISDVESGVPWKDQCQSTSSDDRSMPHELPAPSLSTVQQVSQPQNDNKPEIQHDVVNHNEIIATPEIHIVEENSNKLTQLDIKPSIDVNPEVEQSSSNAQVIVKTTEKDSEISPIEDDRDKKVPPIKLNAPKVIPICEETVNKPGIGEKSDVNNVKKDQKTLLPEKVNDQDLSKHKSIDVSCEEKKVPPIKLNLSASETDVQSTSTFSPQEDGPECSKQVPKLTIKLGTKQSEEAKSPIPKFTIKPIRPPTENVVDDSSQIQLIPNVTKLNIKPIVKPLENVLLKLPDATKNESSDQIPCITKLNIKPILKPPEKINDIHRKSSSSEISESEYSENDESTGTSDQASASDQGASETVPKVTIKLGKPGTESEGKFYTEQNIPKLTIKTIQQTEKDENESKLKLVISQSEEKSIEKIPKFTIKSMSKSESQPLSPKLTIKPIKPPETAINELPKLIISAESCSSGETKDNMHVPKITIKPVTKTDADLVSKTKKSTAVCDSSEHIPLVTKLNIKPIIKPEIREDSADLGDKVPVVSKLNIKPIVKPKDIEVDSSVEDVPKIIKLNIKPLKSPEGISSEEKDCDDVNAEKDNSSIPVVTKLNIKPIVKPVDDACKDTRNDTEENQSSETGNSSDENNDHIPIVTKLNIKPIVKPSEDRSKSEFEENIPVVSKLNIKPIMKPENTSQMSPRKEPSRSDSEQIPIVTKLNIKPLIKPEDTASPASPKKESTKPDMEQIPVVTRLNIKPLIRPEDTKSPHSPKKEDIEKNIPVITKLNIKPLIKPEENLAPASPKKDSSKSQSIPVVTKLNIKPIVKPEEKFATEIQNENLDKPVKNPPLVMKINMKNMSDNTEHDHNLFNNVEGAHSPKLSHSPKVDKLAKFESKSEKLVINNIESEKVDSNLGSPSVITGLLNTAPELNCVPELIASVSNENKVKSSEARQAQEGCSPRLKDFGTNIDSDRSQRNSIQINEIHETNNLEASLMKVSPEVKQASAKQRKSLQNCTLLKKLLSSTKDNLEKSQEVGNNLLMQCERVEVSLTNCNDSKHVERNESDIQHSTEHSNDRKNKNSLPPENQDYSKHRPIQVVCNEVNESVTRPLEISVNEKVSNQSSGQDSPRIILKINKTDHGASSKIITEETQKVTISPVQQENTHETVHDKQSPKKQVLNSRRKAPVEETDISIGKRLRSSRVVEIADKTPILRRNLSKRPSGTDTTTSPPNNEGELSILEAKRLKLEQILSANKSLSVTPMMKMTQISPTKATPEIKPGGKTLNQLSVNNENCPKNGNSKLHNILTNLQAKQMQSLQQNETSIPEKTIVTSEVESNTSTGSSDVIVEITRIENCHPNVQEMIVNENSNFRDVTTPEEMSQDPLDTSKTSTEAEVEPPKVVESTPQPRKRGRPRKIPVSEGPKEVTPVVTALEERPQRSLRLTRERPAILAKPRGRGRGRGRRVDTGSIQPRSPPAESPPPTETVIVIETLDEPDAPPVSPPIDPTSSRIKLPRMTEALDKSTNTCSTPLTTRRRSSLFGETSTDSIPPKSEEYMKSPEVTPRAGRGWRGARGGPRGRTPRNRGRGRGGGRGATYMKETMGIYGRVCGPATTTVELFEEETCMMDDNATPSKPPHLLDEDSQSSVKSSTNDSSNKMKKSKFADIFDSSKVWTAADVKEYTWPPPESSTCDNQVMMIQEQVAMFLGVKSFKRRYPELKRRPVVGEEKDYVLRKGVVTEALCDLGITAVDASDVLDIMLSDYPHKYEEYRSHQRQRQMTETETMVEVKQEEKPSKIDIKSEKTSDKPEPPKVDPEKARQEMAAAAIASALEWNARCNAWRRPACVDLQTMTVHRRRAPQATPARPPPTHCRPPAGFYPHALLPGQFQHHYRTYTPEQLRYFPLNTVIAAPPAPPSPVESSSESEGSWGDSSSSSDDSNLPQHLSAKRKKLTKVKRSSQQEKDKDESRGASTSVGEEQVDTCRVCKLRLEANRKYTHERFLVCAHCNAKLHPSCLELNADTIRKCREYAWQCAECKSCCACRKPQDDDKMLFCDLCDRGFHIYCVGLDRVPQGRWHCVECAICKSCGAREPEGLPAGATPTTSGATPTMSATGSGDAEWHHQTRRGPGGHKVYSHSLCTPCARMR